MAVDACLVGGGEALFGGDVGVAVEAVAGGGSAAGPEVLVGETDGEVGGVVGGEEAEGVVSLVVEEVDALGEVSVVLLPVGDGVFAGDAGSEEDGLPEVGEGELRGIVGEDEGGPGGGGSGDDGPVDGEAGDELHGRLVGPGHGHVGAGDFSGVLVSEERGVGAGDAHAGGVGFVGGCEGVVVPGGGVVEGAVGAVLVAGEGGGVVGVEGGDELGAGFVGLSRDETNQRYGFNGRGDDQLLVGLEAGADADGDLGEAVELVVEGEESEGSVGRYRCGAHDGRVSGRRKDRKSKCA